MLEMQARSIARYLPIAMVEKIIVIDNTENGISRSFISRLKNNYSHFAESLEVVPATDVCVCAAERGWINQQLLKLAICKYIQSKKYVVLDAKNVFISDVISTFFLDGSERACVNSRDFREHPLRGSYDRVMDYLQLDGDKYVACFPQTITPFTFDCEIVGELIKHLEHRGASFEEEFVSNSLTEFFLYSGYLLKSGRSFDDEFHFHQNYSTVLWPESANSGNVKGLIGKSMQNNQPLFSVHRGFYVGCNLMDLWWVYRRYVSAGIFKGGWLSWLQIINYKLKLKSGNLMTKLQRVLKF
ncbi:MAG: DUF6492 family protein [Psychromonas sp.]